MAATGEPLVEFLAMMRQMRRGCAWKRSQTHHSLARFLLEETYETLEAIEVGEAGGGWDHLREELGDLLLQVYFHAVIAEEAGEFTLDEVVGDLAEKMVRRNPHVFGGVDAGDDVETIEAAWQAAKAAEKQRSGVTDGIPPTLPALLYAAKVLRRLDRAGEAPATPPAGTDPDALGERLLALVAEANASDLDPEQELRAAVRRRLP